MYRMLQLVKKTQVFLPTIIDCMQNQRFVESCANRLTLRVISLINVDADLVGASAVHHRHHDVLIMRHVGILLNHRDGLHGVVCNDLTLLLEALHGLLVGRFCQFVNVCRILFLTGEGDLHCQNFKELLTTSVPIVILHDVAHAVPNHIGDIHAQTLSHQSVTALGINHRTLLVHDVVILQQTLTHTKMIFLHLLLRILNGARNHGVLDHLSVFKAETVHHLGNTLRSKQTHQLVFQRNKEHTAAGIALTTATTTQLTVHTTTLMTLRTDDGQTAGSFHFGGQFYIRTASGHVGSNRYGTQTVHAATGFLDNVRFLLMELGIEYLMWNFTH